MVAITIVQMTRLLNVLFSESMNVQARIAASTTTIHLFQTASPSTGFIVQNMLIPINADNDNQTIIKRLENICRLIGLLLYFKVWCVRKPSADISKSAMRKCRKDVLSRTNIGGKSCIRIRQQTNIFAAKERVLRLCICFSIWSIGKGTNILRDFLTFVEQI